MIAAHFTWEETIAWMYDHRTGGDKERSELFDKYDVVSIQRSYSITEQEYLSKKLIIEAKDFKGLNYRGVGWSGLVISTPEFGGAGIVMPGAETYSAFQSGLIDAAELGNPFSNMAGGYHEVTKYAGFPGVHQLSQTGSILIYGKKWRELPPDIQMMVRRLQEGRVIRTNAFNLMEAARAMDRLEAFGTITVRVSPAYQRTWRDVSARLAEGFAKKSPEFKRHWGEMQAFTNLIRPYLTINTPAKARYTKTGVFKWSDVKKELLER